MSRYLSCAVLSALCSLVVPVAAAPASLTMSPPDAAVTNDFILFGSAWRYLDNGTDQGTAWSARTFDDSLWSSGLAQLGYGDNDETTVVSYGPDAAAKYITTYFRHTFSVTNAAAFTNLSLRLLRDDAGIVYLNGTEIFRSPNLPTGPITYLTTSLPPNGENTIDTAGLLANGMLVEGSNVVAVEIHQAAPSSSDVSFDFELIGVRPAETNARPVIAITNPPDGTFFGTPASFVIGASALDPDGTVANVAFYANAVKLGDDLTAPFTFNFAPPAGSYALVAVATDNVGQSTTSSVVNVTVSTNTAPPVVFGKTPAPGNITALTNLSVVFSKAVAGVNASDLLINGLPATGLSGSGSNYTFTFPQPGFGLVAITWASGHGIADTFVPAHAFDTNSAGANWSYQLLDAVPPTAMTIIPGPGATVAALPSISVTFSEAVSGVNASDLLINSTAASSVNGTGAGPYVFSFPPPAQGVVSITWVVGHGIADLTGNPFSAVPWSYTLDSNSTTVVISEIMYHAASENPLEDYIELFNKGGTTVNLDGWHLKSGVDLTFSNVSIPTGGYLVAAANRSVFTNKYPSVTNVVGDWTGTLNNNGENVSLVDAAGNLVDAVRYADNGDWAVRQRGRLDFGYRGWVWFQPHDGGGASLELINPSMSNEHGQNWAASLVPDGTPGRVNSVNTNNVAPLILEVAHFPLIPKSTEPITISARLVDEAVGGYSATLFWRVDAVTTNTFSALAMHDDGVNGDLVANDGLWSARLPAQANNTIIEFYVSATDAQGLTRTWPGPAIAAADGAGPTGQVVNALFQIDDTIYAPTNAQPLFKLIMTANEAAELAAIPGISTLQGPNATMNGSFVSIDGGGTGFYYSVGIRNRGHGSRRANPPNYRVEFRNDDRWKGVEAIILNSRYVHIQHLGSVLARKAGAAGANTYAVQLRVNNVNRAVSGQPMFGSYAANEAQDSDFSAAHFPHDPDGNIYRAVRDIAPPDFNYRGTNYTAYTNTYFKESNASANDWGDLIAMLSVMGTGNAAPFTTDNVRAVVDVEQWMRHLAVMNLFGNNETGLNTGYNDDYFMYAGLNDPRFLLTYYDLDTILGEGGSMGPTAGLFTATANNGSGLAFDRFLNWPDFQPIYYRTLAEILTGPFNQTNFDATVDQVLGGYVASGTIANIKNWMATRRNFVLGALPPITNSNAPVATITGGPRSPTPFTSATFTIGAAPGVGAASYQFSLNGGPYSAETPLATPITLSVLSSGTNTVAVIARGTNGVWQLFSRATVFSWVVNTTVPAVRLNEVLARNVAAFNHSGTFPDAIELYNEGSTTVDLGGLRLSNNKSLPGKFTFPAGTLLVPGANLVMLANNPDGTPGLHLGFNLDADGDSVHLFAAVTNGGAELDSVKFGRQLADLSLARFGTSGEWRLAQPTLGGPNVLQPLGDAGGLRINEWLAASQSQDDFVEIYNPDALPVALGGLYLTDNLLGDPARNLIEPLTFIGGGEFRSFVANGNGNGGDHLNFSLALEQGEIGLFTAELSVIDTVIYGPQQPEVAQGRCPNGGASIVTLGVATPGAPNSCPFVPPAPVADTLLTISNTWRYVSPTNLDGVNWTANGFDDGSWLSGPGLLGQYTPTRQQTLPEPIRTVVVTNLSFPTFYARAHFNVPAGVTYTSLQLRHIIDDGAAFHLNGVEIPGSRFNLPADALTSATLASPTVTDGAYSSFISVPASMLVAGDNVLAVEVHQATANSSDSAMGVELQGLIVTNSPAVAGVVINEMFANNASFAEPDGSKPDWIELYNPSANAVDVGDMSLTDDTTVSRRWVFPAGTILSAAGFQKVRCDAGLPASTTNTGFGLKASGGGVFLFNKIVDGGSLLSSVAYGLQAADFSIGRVPNGSANWALLNPSPGDNNLAAALGNAALLKINEWMANPASGEDYFEIYNPNPQPVDISGFYLTDDLSNRAKHQLSALSFIGVGQDAFQEFTADNNTVAGADHVNFKLAATGEALGLTSSNNVAIDSVSFGPQGLGVSQGRLPDGAAVMVDFPATPTPGKPNFLPVPNLFVNELLAHSDPPFEDAVEFYNAGPTSVNIGGWYLSDSQNNLLKYRIPADTILPAGGYAVFYEYQFNSDAAAQPFSFSSAKGDEVYLSQSITAGTVTGYRAFATFGASENGVSFGRFLTSAGADFTAMSAHTFGQDNPVTTNQFRLGTGLTNAYPKIGPVVFNELMYHPASTNEVFEFIELRNITASAVPLYDPANPANTWRLRKGVEFNFATGTTIPAGGYLVVVSFDPVADPVSLAFFQSVYGANVTLVGPYVGKLDNNGEALELLRPDAPQTRPGPDFGLVPYIVVDRVVYGDAAPWPASPDGSGDALKKITSHLYGNEPLNWQGGAPTPGAANFAVATNSPPMLAAIANGSVHQGHSVNFTVSATDADLPGQTLTFNLDGAPPAGASIDPASGVFNWTTATNQGPATYQFTVRVTDNGTPPLSDSRAFSITVLSLPRVNSVQVTDGTVRLEWESFLGRRYRLETTTSLTDPNWTQLGDDIIAGGTTAFVVVAGGADLERFYRIISEGN